MFKYHSTSVSKEVLFIRNTSSLVTILVFPQSLPVDRPNSSDLDLRRPPKVLRLTLLRGFNVIRGGSKVLETSLLGTDVGGRTSVDVQTCDFLNR